jgi:hypothetical protein
MCGSKSTLESNQSIKQSINQLHLISCHFVSISASLPLDPCPRPRINMFTIHGPNRRRRNRIPRLLDDVLLTIGVSKIHLALLGTHDGILHEKAVVIDRPRARRRKFVARVRPRGRRARRHGNAQREQRAQRGERASNQPDAFFHERPEADGACAEEEFAGIAVEREVTEADNGCAAGTAVVG